jgi:hypothetical protein
MNLHVSHTLGYSRNWKSLEYLKIETRLIDEKFVSVRGECDLDVMDTPSKLIVIRKVVSLGRVRPTLLLSWAGKTV